MPKIILAQDVIGGEWAENAQAFIVPGGRDIPYTEKLNGAGNAAIKKYVKEGGTYWGICAGAYYASSYVTFAQGTEIEVLGDRELCFFPGVAEGPLVPYEYNSESGARYVDINWLQNKKNLEVYYNGGCYFKNLEQFSNVNVLATYQSLAPQQAAIVKCVYEKGYAILSGVHIEHATEHQNVLQHIFIELLNS